MKVVSRLLGGDRFEEKRESVILSVEAIEKAAKLQSDGAWCGRENGGGRRLPDGACCQMEHAASRESYEALKILTIHAVKNTSNKLVVLRKE